MNRFILASWFSGRLFGVKRGLFYLILPKGATILQYLIDDVKRTF